MSFRDFFPVGLSPRPVQIEALERIEDALVTQNKRIFVLDGPTGCGKSAIARAAARAMGSAFITSPQNILVDQYAGEAQELTPIKGKSNYLCSAFPFPDHIPAEERNCETADDLNENLHKSICRDYCPQRDEFWCAPLSVTNVDFAYWAPMPPRLEARGRDHRHLLVLDEAHNLEEKLLDLGKVQITVRQALRVRVSLYAGQNRNEVARFIVTFLEAVWKAIPTFSKKEKRTFSRKAQALKLALEVGDWIHWRDDTTGALVIQPMNCKVPAARLFRKAGKLLLMSATIGLVNQFLAGLNIDPAEAASYAAPSDFPASNRPIQIVRRNYFTSKNKARSIRGAVDGCRQLLRHYATVKGAILMPSYELSRELVAALRPEFGERIISHVSKEAAKSEALTSDEAVELHKKSPGPTVLFGVALEEGLDLKDDEARFLIIAKTMYGYLGDPYIAERMRRDKEWYVRQTALSMVQACGRVIRSATDPADIFVLDSCFLTELAAHREHYPQWFLDAVIDCPAPLRIREVE